jgi:LuxR family transcriptional regulator, regulator of acetate metabolism
MTQSTLANLLQHTVDTVRRDTGVPVAFSGIATRSGLLLGTPSGMRTGALDGLLVAREQGLGGRALQIRRPISVHDYSSAGTISHLYDHQVGTEGLVSMTAVPVVVGRRVPVVLYGALRHPGSVGDLGVQGLVEAARNVARVLEDRGSQSTAPDGTGEADPRLADLTRRVRGLAASIDAGPLREELLASCDRLELGRSPAVDEPPALSPHELEILALVASGCANEVIAQLLDTSCDAVKAHLHKAMRRLGARSRHAAASVARSRGLLP